MKVTVNKVLMVETCRDSGEYLTSRIVDIPISQGSRTYHALEDIKRHLQRFFPESEIVINNVQEEVKRTLDNLILLYSVVSVDVALNIQ